MAQKTIEHQLVIPPTDEDASKGWRKLLTGLDENAHGGAVCLGHWLSPGATYRLRAGDLIIGADTTPAGYHVRLWRVTRSGGLTVMRDSILARKSTAFGVSVRKTLSTALAKYPPVAGPAPMMTGDAPNTTDAPCEQCGQNVPAGTGLERDAGTVKARVLHHPSCPPAPPKPRPNAYAGACAHCGSLVDAGAGVLVTTATGRRKAQHHPDCPPAEQRRQVPPTENLYEGTCQTCAQTVAAYAGLYQDGKTRHRDGQCPPPPGDGQPTWRIGKGEPGRWTRTAPPSWPLGHVLRSDVWETGTPVPETTPGYRLLSQGRVSAFFTVVQTFKSVYCRDEDGDNPADLIGEDGWWHTALVRPATTDEAASLLAVEAQTARGVELARRTRAAFSWRYSSLGDAEYPAQVDLTGAVEVHLKPPVNLRYFNDQLWVDENAGLVFSVSYNGADGDDWSLNNWGSHVVAVQPLTEQRRALIADLRAQYPPPAPKPAPPTAPAPTVRAPAIPDDATRVIIPNQRPYHPDVTSSPQRAREALTRRIADGEWTPELAARLNIARGPVCVHVGGFWSLWDDGALLANIGWLDYQERKAQPRTLNEAAIAALDLVAAGGPHSALIDRAVWHPLRQATAHTSTTVEERSRNNTSSWAGKKLIRHDFTTPGGPVVWWELHTYDGGWAGGDADHTEHRLGFDNEATARAAYREHRI